MSTKTVIKNISGSARRLTWLPPHGASIAAGVERVIEGDIFTLLNNSRSGRASLLSDIQNKIVSVTLATDMPTCRLNKLPPTVVSPQLCACAPLRAPEAGVATIMPKETPAPIVRKPTKAKQTAPEDIVYDDSAFPKAPEEMPAFVQVIDENDDSRKSYGLDDKEIRDDAVEVTGESLAEAFKPEANITAIKEIPVDTYKNATGFDTPMEAAPKETDFNGADNFEKNAKRKKGKR